MRPTALRLAALGSCALIPLIAQAAQMQASSAFKPAGKNAPILLQADEIDYDSEGKTVSAVGHVEIVQQGRTLQAERVDYDQNTDTVTARGHVVMIDQRGNVAFSDHVVLKDQMRDGVLQGFGALIGKNGRLAARAAQRVNGTTVVARRTNYSPCKICNQPGKRTPLWQVKSERVVYDQDKHKIRFRSAIIDVEGVPVAWVPTFTISDPTVRYASGILIPTLGNSSVLGNYFRLPFYVSLSQSQDMTIEPTISSSGGDVLELEYRNRWDDGGMWLQGSGAYNPAGGLGGSPGAQTYGHIFGSGRLQLNDTWRTGFDVQATSNPGYMRFYDISYLDKLISDLFIEDTPGRSRFALTSYYFQGLRSTDVTSRIPYILPQVDYTYIPQQEIAGGTFNLHINGISLGRDDGSDEQRLTSEVNWKVPTILSNGQVWTFTFDARGDIYHFQDPTLLTQGANSGTTADSNIASISNDAVTVVGKAPSEDYFLQRGTAYVGLDWRWPFLAAGAPGYSYIVSPIVQLVAQPYGGNPAGLRIEDANDFELTAENVFSFNHMPGYDLIEGGPRANFGFSAQALMPTGEIDAQIGQTYQLKPDPLLALFTGDDGNASDIAGSISFKFPHFDFTDRFDVDRASGSIKQNEIFMIGSYGRSSLEVSYIQLPATLSTIGLPAQREINTQADLNVWSNWEVFAAVQRDLQANQLLNTEYGIGYEDECLGISLAYRSKYAQNLALGIVPSNSVVLRFNLKTGDTPIEPFSLFPKNVFALTRP